MEKRIDLPSKALPVRGFRGLAAALKEVTEAQGTDFFVIGALARSILLEGVHGHSVRRATRDLDVALAVSGWDTYQAITNALVDAHDFERSTIPHRFHHPSRGPIDLIPFGDLEDPPGTIEWAEDARAMSTSGLREAYAAAKTVWIDGGLPVKVASIEGQALLKLFAWRDRPTRKRDAEDFCLLLRAYYDIRTRYVYDKHIDIFGGEHSLAEAQGRVYGREVASLVKSRSEIRASVIQLLEEQTTDPHASAFVNAMASPQCFRSQPDRFDAFKGFLRGFREESSGQEQK